MDPVLSAIDLLDPEELRGALGMSQRDVMRECGQLDPDGCNSSKGSVWKYENGFRLQLNADARQRLDVVYERMRDELKRRCATRRLAKAG